MLLRDVIVILLVFGIVIAGSATLVGDITGQYGINASTAFSETYDKINETQEKTEDMEEEISSKGGFLTTSFDIIVKGTFYVLQMILGTLSTVKTMVYDMMTAFGLPTWFGLAIIGIMVVVVVTLIISAVLRKEV